LLSRWPIRYKLLFGVATLCLIVAILSVSGFRGVYAYRELVRNISDRALERPAAADLARSVDRLRAAVTPRPEVDFPGRSIEKAGLQREAIGLQLTEVIRVLDQYKVTLNQSDSGAQYLGDKHRERETVGEIEKSLETIGERLRSQNWITDSLDKESLAEEVYHLGELTDRLPSYLQKNMEAFRNEVRGQYRALIGLTWTATVLTGLMLVMLVRLGYMWMFKPLRILIAGSRRVAGGDFDHRIHLDTHDEVAELAMAMNEMTWRFQQIRDDLDLQVKQRTKEVVRSEQLASVGFLAAGVSHEINNPLASIAWCAESLESRLYDILNDTEIEPDQEEEVNVLRIYLRRIQDEAFRCKGITEKLLDFSRMGDIEKQDTDLRELVEVVIDMVKHLGKYRRKNIEFHCDSLVVVPVNSQEIKQVVLNLITNALDSLDEDGTVWVELQSHRGRAELTVRDDGCGMTQEVLKHLFEPFFTRRRGGEGTGLGLSITYRIVSDHGGEIEAYSDGSMKGSTFKVTLPLSRHEKEEQRKQQAA
jgi:two-component system NtrC family sensor kinase